MPNIEGISQLNTALGHIEITQDNTAQKVSLKADVAPELRHATPSKVKLAFRYIGACITLFISEGIRHICNKVREKNRQKLADAISNMDTNAAVKKLSNIAKKSQKEAVRILEKMSPQKVQAIIESTSLFTDTSTKININNKIDKTTTTNENTEGVKETKVIKDKNSEEIVKIIDKATTKNKDTETVKKTEVVKNNKDTVITTQNSINDLTERIKNKDSKEIAMIFEEVLKLNNGDIKSIISTIYDLDPEEAGSILDKMTQDSALSILEYIGIDKGPGQATEITNYMSNSANIQ